MAVQGCGQSIGRKGERAEACEPTAKGQREGVLGQTQGYIGSFWNLWETFYDGASTWALPYKRLVIENQSPPSLLCALYCQAALGNQGGLPGGKD